MSLRVLEVCVLCSKFFSYSLDKSHYNANWTRCNVPLNTLQVILGTGFYGSNNPNDSVKALKEVVVPRIRLQSHQVHLTMLQKQHILSTKYRHNKYIHVYKVSSTTSGVADYHKQQPTRHVTLACYCGPGPINATYSFPVVFHTITSSHILKCHSINNIILRAEYTTDKNVGQNTYILPIPSYVLTSFGRLSISFSTNFVWIIWRFNCSIWKSAIFSCCVVDTILAWSSWKACINNNHQYYTTGFSGIPDWGWRGTCHSLQQKLFKEHPIYKHKQKITL